MCAKSQTHLAVAHISVTAHIQIFPYRTFLPNFKKNIWLNKTRFPKESPKKGETKLNDKLNNVSDAAVAQRLKP